MGATDRPEAAQPQSSPHGKPNPTGDVAVRQHTRRNRIEPPIPSNRPRSYDDAAVIEHTTGATLS